MPKFTFKCEHYDYHTEEVESTHVTEFKAESLDQVVENFEMFLRGSGYHFDGHLDFSEDVFTTKDDNDGINFDGHQAGPTLTTMDNDNEELLHIRV